MYIVFILLFLLALILLPIALIKPALLTKGLIARRKKALAVFGGATLLFFILAVATTPPAVNNQTQVKGIAQADRNESQATKPVESSPSPTVFKAQTAPNNPNIVLAKVIKVIDGDTIEVDLGDGNMKTVRYIGIDTSESVDPRQTVQCFGKEASDKNKELVGNGIVGLEKDVSETDRYGRLLRYVYMGDLFINQALVAEGYARASSYPPDVKYQDKFRTAEQQARINNKGLWGACATTSPTSKPATNTTGIAPKSTGTTTQSTGSTSGGDKDCKDFKTQAEAQAYFNSKGGSASNNVDRLDADSDGKVCESLP
ncbi:thermonuclease family protein [Patescibacteria group bacterium]|nr:thermonuclease family protein [Patescibacteria group bacterium]